MVSIRLGDLLVKAKVITDVQLKSALAEQAKWGGRLGEILVRMNILTEDMLVKALSKQLGIPAVNLDSIDSIPANIKAKIPAEVARDVIAVPLQLRDDNKSLVVAMAEPQNLKHVDALRAISRCRILPQVAGRQMIARAFNRFYESDGDIGGTPSEGTNSFKLIDAQGHTVIRPLSEIVSTKKKPTTPEVPLAAPPPPTEPKRTLSLELPSAAQGKSSLELLQSVEAAQRKEVAALKAMVEILIEKGVFTREEYLAKVKR